MINRLLQFPPSTQIAIIICISILIIVAILALAKIIITHIEYESETTIDFQSNVEDDDEQLEELEDISEDLYQACLKCKQEMYTSQYIESVNKALEEYEKYKEEHN